MLALPVTGSLVTADNYAELLAPDSSDDVSSDSDDADAYDNSDVVTKNDHAYELLTTAAAASTHSNGASKRNAGSRKKGVRNRLRKRWSSIDVGTHAGDGPLLTALSV